MRDRHSQGAEIPGIVSGVSLAEGVYRALCQMIRDGGYRPGERLREEEVAERMSVSRTPVRGALGRLVAKGLLVQTGGRGLVVRELSVDEVMELYALREILEGAAARMASQQATQLEIDNLADIQEAFEGKSDSTLELAQLNRMFHQAIFHAAHNRYLDNALQDLQNFIGLLGPTTFGAEGRPVTAVDEHRDILAAIVARDPDKAEAVARNHIREALRARLKLLRR